MVQASAAIIVLVYINFGCLTGSATGAGPLAVCLGGKWEGGRGGWDVMSTTQTLLWRVGVVALLPW